MIRLRLEMYPRAAAWTRAAFYFMSVSQGLQNGLPSPLLAEIDLGTDIQDGYSPPGIDLIHCC